MLRYDIKVASDSNQTPAYDSPDHGGSGEGVGPGHCQPTTEPLADSSHTRLDYLEYHSTFLKNVLLINCNVCA